MEIKQFCNKQSDEDLNKYWESCIETRENIINNFADPDIVASITEAISNKECHLLEDEAIEIAVCFLGYIQRCCDGNVAGAALDSGGNYNTVVAANDHAADRVRMHGKFVAITSVR